MNVTSQTSATATRASHTSVERNHGNMADSGGCCAGGHLGARILQSLHKLDNGCSNNQAEQLAIAKALEALETIDIEKNSSRTAAIITDSRISLDPIKNVNNHSYLIEEIR